MGRGIKQAVHSGLEVQTADIADDAITADKIAATAVVTAAILDANITTAKIADTAVTTAKILDANVTTAKIANTAVTTAKILDSNVTEAKIRSTTVSVADLGTAPTAVAHGLTVPPVAVFPMITEIITTAESYAVVIDATDTTTMTVNITSEFGNTSTAAVTFWSIG